MADPKDFQEKKEYLEYQRNRVIASILSYKDEYCDPHLPDRISSELRRQILDHVNQLYNVAIDLLSEDIIYNELFMERFNDLYEMVSEIYDD